MGEVWLSTDKLLDRQVAIKTTINNTDAKTKSVFYDEAKTGASLIGHPNIVSILDYGVVNKESELDETHYIVMEYIDGMTVSRFITEFKPKLDEETYYYLALYISWELCSALEYAHKKSILHRDIKPLNIFLSNIGVTRVGDFGLARYIDAATRTHTVVNFKSPAYAAPEQWKDEKYTESTDIYQLGCTLYHLLTGQLVFNKSNLALMNAHLNDKPVPPSNINKRISSEVSGAILGMLKKNKNEREGLWFVNDTIAKELQKSLNFTIKVDPDNEEEIKKIADITDFPEEDLKGDLFSFDFPDFAEVLSEGLQLLLNGISNFKISTKKIVTNEEKTA